MNIKDILKNRYTVKKFDTTKKISNEDMQTIKDILQMSPSSVNMQPWNFTIATSQEAKDKIAKSTEEFGFNIEKVKDAAAVVVFNVKNNISDEFLNTLLEQEDKDGRYPQEQFKIDMNNGRKFFLGVHEDTLKDTSIWLAKQVYLNAGHFTLGTANMGIDSVIMEGFNPQVLSDELELNKNGYTPLLIIGLGYRAQDDFNSTLAKSRLPQESIITEL